MNKRTLRFLSRYDYGFPANLVASAPAFPRDSARLLVYKKKGDRVHYDSFLKLPAYLPKRAVLVFNQTKVLPARFVLQKETGGKSRALYVGKRNGALQVLSDRGLKIGSRPHLYGHPGVSFFVERKEGKYYFLKPSFPMGRLFPILQRYGKTPIPPYIKNTPLSERELRKAYQAVFARENGSVAAPTASLHFTKRLLGRIKRSGASAKFITLHVGLGTFAPLEESHIKKSALHKEYYEIDRGTAKFLKKAKREKRPIVAVGTTAVRALESASDERGILKKLSGETSLFIREGYRFRFVDGIITNFHVPRSSLFMLMSAFAGRKKITELYLKAIGKRFRLFSFGDGMFIY